MMVKWNRDAATREQSHFLDFLPKTTTTEENERKQGNGHYLLHGCRQKRKEQEGNAPFQKSDEGGRLLANLIAECLFLFPNMLITVD